MKKFICLVLSIALFLPSIAIADIDACSSIKNKTISGVINDAYIEFDFFSQDGFSPCEGQFLMRWEKPIEVDGRHLYELGRLEGPYTADSNYPVIWIMLGNVRYMLFIIGDVAYAFDDSKKLTLTDR